MINTIYPKTDTFKAFEQNNASVQNAGNKNPVAQNKRPLDKGVEKLQTNRKKIAIGAGLLALTGAIVYYKMASKPLKLPKENPIIAAPQSEFEKYITEQNLESAAKQALEECREQYQKCANSMVGKIHSAIRTVQKFFKKNFFNY